MVKIHGIEIYALLQVDAYNETIFNVCLDTPEAKQEYLQEIENNVLYKRDMNITEDDHLVLLTTCTSDMTNGRNILVGRLTDQIYPEKGKMPKIRLNSSVQSNRSLHRSAHWNVICIRYSATGSSLTASDGSQ